MLRAFLELIETLLHPKAPGNGRPQAAVAANVVAPPAAPTAAEAFEDRLSEIAAQQDSVIAGSLELIGLDDVRDALGDLWAAVSLQVSEFATAEIEQCLDPDDIFRPHGESGFLIHFDGLDKDESDRKAKQIALRIKAGLAERFPQVADAVSIKHFLAEVDTESLRDGAGSLANKLFARLLKMRKDAERAAGKSRQSFVKDFQVLFAPAWHTRTHVTVLNRCLLDTRYLRTSLAQYQELVDPDQLAATYVDLDYLILTKSVEALHRLLQTNRSATLLIPVSYQTINRHSILAEYVRLLDAVPDPYRKFLVIEICGVAEDSSPSQISRMVEALKLHTKNVVVELSLEHPCMGFISKLGAWAISLDLSEMSSTDPLLPARLAQFAAAASVAAIGSIARGANSVGMALAAAKAGFTFINGAGIHLPIAEPRPPVRLMPLSRASRQTSRLN